MFVLEVFCFALWSYSQGQSGTVAPLFVRASLPHIITLSSKVGDNVQLNCSSDGEPRPDISWYKYSIPLSDITYRRLEDTVKFGKLVLSKILLADAGNYSCHVNGSINRTFILTVHESSNSRPVILDSLMTNKTAVLGGEASFHCHVTSGSVTYVRWYFKRNTVQLNAYDNLTQATVKVIESIVPVKVSSVVGNELNGHPFKAEAVFLVRNVSRHDEGEYICETFNEHGKVRCGAFLVVVEGPTLSAHELEAKYAALVDMKQEFPLAVVIAIPVFFLIILTAVFIRALEKVKQKHGVGLVKKTDVNGDAVVMHLSCSDKESSNQKLEKEIVITQPRRVLNYAKCNGVPTGQQITQLSKQVTCAEARCSSEQLPSSQASGVGSKRCSAALELEWDGIELDMKDGFQMIKLSKEEEV